MYAMYATYVRVCVMCVHVTCDMCIYSGTAQTCTVGMYASCACMNVSCVVCARTRYHPFVVCMPLHATQYVCCTCMDVRCVSFCLDVCCRELVMHAYPLVHVYISHVTVCCCLTHVSCTHSCMCFVCACVCMCVCVVYMCLCALCVCLVCVSCLCALCAPLC